MGDTKAAQSWAQPQLFPTDVYEFSLRVGVVRSGDHAQIQYEVRDPSSGDVLRMESRPYLDLRDVFRALDPYWTAFVADLSALVWPFPDHSPEDLELFEADYDAYCRLFELDQENGNEAPHAEPMIFAQWLSLQSDEYLKGG